MGEVYRAHDTRLERTVAIKVLNSALIASPELRARFEREAKTISQLTHPNICTLYDIGCDNGTDYLVMEFLEGESLADRLRRGPLPTSEVLRIGIEVASALDRAHAASVLHRDLKPGNIMLTRAGAKLLDFGLAKPLAMPAAAGSGTVPVFSALPTSPALASPLTSAGSLVGTVQYMSPEQIEGREATTRSDIFAFGAVLYEMCTGRRAFDGKSQLSVASAILEKDPAAVQSLQPKTPVVLDEIIRTCIAKDPAQRFGCAHDIALRLKSVKAYVEPAEREGGAVGAASKAAFAAILCVLLAIAIFASWKWRQATQASRFVTRSFLTLPNQVPANFFLSNAVVLSPDGQNILYVEGHDQSTNLAVLSLTTGDVHSFPSATVGRGTPFWSPDSRNIGFFSDGKLRRLSLDGSIRTVCDFEITNGLSQWTADGTIFLVPVLSGDVYTVAASGGTPKRVFHTDAGLIRSVSVLPDGHHFVFVISSDAAPGSAAAEIMIGSIDGDAPQPLNLQSTRQVRYASNALIYAAGDTLIAAPFDASQRKVTGEPVVLLDEKQGFEYTSFFSVSENGMLVYRPTATRGGVTISIANRTGRLEATDIPPGRINNPRFSPDGSRIAYDLAGADGRRDIWVYDIARRVNTRVTLGTGLFSDPLWSPDGKQIAMQMADRGAYAIVVKALDGSSTPPQRVYEQGKMAWARSWSPDGRSLFLDIIPPDRNYPAVDVASLPLDGSGKIVRLFDDRFTHRTPQISPDGHWLAYSSSETGREEIYVQTYPGAGARTRVSTHGGIMPRWRGDGREIFFIDVDSQVSAAEITLSEGRVTVGKTSKLFAFHPLFPGGNPLDVTRDGKAFVLADTGGQSSAPVRLVTNWDTLVHR